MTRIWSRWNPISMSPWDRGPSDPRDVPWDQNFCLKNFLIWSCNDLILWDFLVYWPEMGLYLVILGLSWLHDSLKRKKAQNHYRQVCLGWHSVRLGWHSMHTLWLPENGRNWLSIQPKMAHSFSASNMPMQADTMPTQADSTVMSFAEISVVYGRTDDLSRTASKHRAVRSHE